MQKSAFTPCLPSGFHFVTGVTKTSRPGVIKVSWISRCISWKNVRLCVSVHLLKCWLNTRECKINWGEVTVLWSSDESSFIMNATSSGGKIERDHLVCYEHTFQQAASVWQMDGYHTQAQNKSSSRWLFLFIQFKTISTSIPHKLCVPYTGLDL